CHTKICHVWEILPLRHGVFRGSTKYFTGPASRRAKTVRPRRNHPLEVDTFARSVSLSKRVGRVLIAHRNSRLQHPAHAVIFSPAVLKITSHGSPSTIYDNSRRQTP